MNKNRTSFSFLLEYLFVILFIAISSVITVRIFVLSYHMCDISLRKKEALEYAQNYIEKGEYRIEQKLLNSDFESDENGDYLFVLKKKEDSDKAFELTINYKEEELIDLSFYGEVHE